LNERFATARTTRRHGARLVDHGVAFNLWAPSAKSVELLEVGQPPQPMPRDDDGWYQLISKTAAVGTRYQFRINGDLVVPDPASFYQPDDVGNPSEVIDTASFRDAKLYKGRSWAEAVICELHVGTFSEEKTYAGVQKKLPYLQVLGITAIELMPLNDVPGRYNWAMTEDPKRLLKAAHDLDIMVYLDGVYNHSARN
jgi:maltooligosyltrehalose trehalohydrolase